MFNACSVQTKLTRFFEKWHAENFATARDTKIRTTVRFRNIS